MSLNTGNRLEAHSPRKGLRLDRVCDLSAFAQSDPASWLLNVRHLPHTEIPIPGCWSRRGARLAATRCDVRVRQLSGKSAPVSMRVA